MFIKILLFYEMSYYRSGYKPFGCQHHSLNLQIIKHERTSKIGTQNCYWREFQSEIEVSLYGRICLRCSQLSDSYQIVVR